MDFRRLVLAYLELPNSILIKQKQLSSYNLLCHLPVFSLFAHAGPMAVWDPVLLSYINYAKAIWINKSAAQVFSPLISTGVPTAEMFARNALSPSDESMLRQCFANSTLPSKYGMNSWNARWQVDIETPNVTLWIGVGRLVRHKKSLVDPAL